MIPIQGIWGVPNLRDIPVYSRLKTGSRRLTHQNAVLAWFGFLWNRHGYKWWISQESSNLIVKSAAAGARIGSSLLTSPSICRTRFDCDIPIVQQLGLWLSAEKKSYCKVTSLCLCPEYGTELHRGMQSCSTHPVHWICQHQRRSMGREPRILPSLGFIC